MEKKKGFWSEFKEFISRGNVMDMAVGVVVGAAFTAIVNALVGNIIMPFVGWIIGGLDFSQYKIVLSPAMEGVEETAIAYGSFIQSVVNFLIIAFIVFLIVKAINSFHRKKEEAPAPEPAPDPQVELLTEIRDLLKKETADVD